MSLIAILLWVFALILGVQVDDGISQAAQGRAERQEFYHDLSVYPASCGTGEVLAMGSSDPFTVLWLWFMSPAHWQVIWRPWDRVGVGESGGLVVVAFQRDCAPATVRYD